MFVSQYGNGNCIQEEEVKTSRLFMSDPLLDQGLELFANPKVVHIIKSYHFNSFKLNWLYHDCLFNSFTTDIFTWHW